MIKNPPAIAGDTDSVPGSGISPGEGNGNPLQYSILGNPMDRRAWQAIVLGVSHKKSGMTKTHIRGEFKIPNMCQLLKRAERKRNKSGTSKKKKKRVALLSLFLKYT